MTVVTIAAAILRLPIEGHWKLLALLPGWGFLMLWVQYSSPPGVTQKVRLAVLRPLGSMIIFCFVFVVVIGDTHVRSFPKIMFGLMFLAVTGMQIAAAFWQVRIALRSKREQR
mgnify:CR=1 FL=1